MGNDNKKDGAKTVAAGGPLVSVQIPPRVSQPLGLKRRQLCIGVLDVSGSMSGPKIGEALDAMRALNLELGKKENGNAFATACVVFGQNAKAVLKPTLSSTVAPEAITASALNEFTNITAGLAEALTLLSAPPIERGNWVRPVVVLMTDGEHNHGDPPDTVAQELKSKADLICVGFGFGADLNLLKRIATSPQHAFMMASGTDLRRFFATIGATMSVSIQSGQNAAALLSGGVVKG